MQLNVSFLPSEETRRNDICIIVLDILRASSTIVSAFEAGCRSVVPVKDVNEALNLKAENPQFLLCGERGGRPPKGFDLGNSPAEYTPQTVQERDLILTTSNGTRAILCGADDSLVLIGGFLNFSAVLDKALISGKDILIQCAGSDGAFALEDTFAAALFVDALNRRVCNMEIGDSARWALYALKGMAPGKSELSALEIETVLRNSAHGKRLIAAGFSEDISLCAQKDTSRLMPLLSQNKLMV